LVESELHFTPGQNISVAICSKITFSRADVLKFTNSRVIAEKKTEVVRVGTQSRHSKARSKVVAISERKQALLGRRTIDLFCGAGGITEGFKEAGYNCLYANDCVPEAIETFKHNHPAVWADGRTIEDVKPAEIRSQLDIAKGELDVLVGGPPCQGFSINAPERFPTDPSNKLFKDYVRFL
jgi:DNA (cytosine-5)-methyltransferase 1